MLCTCIERRNFCWFSRWIWWWQNLWRRLRQLWVVWRSVMHSLIIALSCSCHSTFSQSVL